MSMTEAVEIIHDPRSAMLLPSNDPRRVAFEAKVAQELAARAVKEAAARAAEVPPSPADCRAALRTAVARHGNLTRRLRDLTKALPAADTSVVQARRAVEAAKQALEEATATAASHAAARALGMVGTTPPPLRNARAKLADAEDALAISRAAAADLASQHQEAEQTLVLARLGLNEALSAVVVSDLATQKLIEEFERARRQYAELRQAIEVVASHFPTQARRLALTSDQIADGRPSAKRVAWERAIATLREDADAELPT